MEKRKSTTPKPRPLIYLLARWFCCVISKLLFRLKVTGQKSLPKEGPLLVMATHQGMMDVVLAVAALKGRKAQFVATMRQYRHPKLHWLYVRMGVIPKVQFHTDPRCVMNILRVLKGGGTVVIFPAGQTSMWGVPGNISPAMAHLVKKAGVPVCTLGLRGGFFSAPRFGGLRFGRTEARLDLTFTPEQLKGLSEEEIFAILRDKLHFDKYQWQKETGVRFKGKDLALGYDQMLLYCPKCGGVGTWHSEGDTVRCTACGNTGRIGSDMRMLPAGEGDRVFETLTQWYDWQEEQVVAHIQKPDFLLEEPVTCRLFDEQAFSYRDAGTGRLLLDREGIRYEGTVDGQPVCLSIRHAHLPGLSAEPGVYVELYHEGYGLVRYIPQGKPMVAQMKLAQEYLYRQTQG